MTDKLKKLSSYLLVLVVALILGFAPVAEKKILTIRWGDLGLRLVEAGVIDPQKFPDFYREEELAITPENSKIVLNTLWAFGLANQNEVLEKGPMMDPQYGGADRFASTGGWTLGVGHAMNHFSMHEFFKLSPEEQALVEKTAKNIYRPCCGNSAYFPDCNHGMAMLGLLELMAREGWSEEEMYKMAEKANEYWFPKLEANCGA